MFPYFFLVFLSLIFIISHASIKKPVKMVDFCDLNTPYKIFIDIFELNKKVDLNKKVKKS